METSLSEEAKSIGSVSAEAAEAYWNNSPATVDRVNTIVGSLPNYSELTGGNPRHVVTNNHQNHTAFMYNVFHLNSWDLLVSVLPWVYRSYMGHGFSSGYFPEVVKAFMESVLDNLQPEHAEEINRVYQWMLDHHTTILRESASAPEPVLKLDLQEKKIKDEFLAYLLRGDFGNCYDLVSRSVSDAGDIRRIYMKVLQPSLYDVGNLWERDEVSVAQEHLCTSIVGRIMARLYDRILEAEKGKGKAVIAAFMNEYHEIGARMVSDFLEAGGWSVDYLGANVPVEDLMDYLKLSRPFLLGISLCMPFNLVETAATVRRIREMDGLEDMKIMVGGLSLLNNRQLWRSLGADGFAPDAEGALELADSWWREDQ